MNFYKFTLGLVYFVSMLISGSSVVLLLYKVDNKLASVFFVALFIANILSVMITKEQDKLLIDLFKKLQEEKKNNQDGN